LAVNLAAGKTEQANQVLHLSVRFYEDIIVRNSQYDNEWGHEERDENLDEFAVHNPLVAGI
jgi:Galactoside-binding lectin